MAKNEVLTPEIIIGVLRHSSLNTVLIEGKDDLFVYRQLQKEINCIQVDFFPCGGRKNLLSVYEKKIMLPGAPLFLCDSDMWVFLPKPTNITSDLVSTLGYSIENEIYQDAKELLDRLLEEDELWRKSSMIEELCRWFAYEVKLAMDGEPERCGFAGVSLLNPKVMERYKDHLKEEFLNGRMFVASPDLEATITKSYMRLLRGKFIFQIYDKIFQERTSDIKYTTTMLFDLAIRHIINSSDSSKILIQKKRFIEAHFMNQA